MRGLASSVRSSVRFLSTFTSTRPSPTRVCQALVCTKFGNPEDSLELQELPLADPKEDEVEVKYMASPVNPADINILQGVYPLKLELPAVAGNEGVGVVTKCGRAVSSVKEGDWVIPAAAGIGSWRTHVVTSAKKFMAIPSDISVHLAATLTVNPPTAYRMLKDFVQLQPGDTVIQNGANSAVGQNVIQLAAAWGLRTINVVRNRPDLVDLIAYLEDFGADRVITEEQLASYRLKEIFSEYKAPLLGLNCVGGKSATNLIRTLGEGGVLVTYGGMSKQPIPVTTGSFIFRDVSCRGYWNTRWVQNNLLSDQHVTMVSDLCELGRQRKLKMVKYKERSLQDYKNALSKATEPFTTSKQMFVMPD